MIKSMKKIVQPDGSVKVYEYTYDKPRNPKYAHTAYENKKKAHPKVECEKCHKMVYPYYMKKHQENKICNESYGKNFKIINNNDVTINV